VVLALGLSLILVLVTGISILSQTRWRRASGPATLTRLGQRSRCWALFLVYLVRGLIPTTRSTFLNFLALPLPLCRANVSRQWLHSTASVHSLAPVGILPVSTIESPLVLFQWD